MELLRRYSGLKVSVVYRPRRLERFERLELFERATVIAERFGGFDEGLGSRNRRAIRKRSRLNRKSKMVSDSHQG